MTPILLFLAGFSLDIAWAYYIRFVAEGRPWAAGVASVACAVPGLLGVAVVIQDPPQFAWYGLGLFTGTVVAVKVREQR